MEIAALNVITNAAPVSATAPLQPAPANAEIVCAVEAANRIELLGEGNRLAFRFDPETRRPVIEVLDVDTGEVVRQIPPEYLLRVMENLVGPPKESLE